MCKILLPMKFRLKEVRVLHFEISYPRDFTPLSPRIFSLRFRFKEVR